MSDSNTSPRPASSAQLSHPSQALNRESDITQTRSVAGAEHHDGTQRQIADEATRPEQGDIKHVELLKKCTRDANTHQSIRRQICRPGPQPRPGLCRLEQQSAAITLPSVTLAFSLSGTVSNAKSPTGCITQETVNEIVLYQTNCPPTLYRSSIAIIAHARRGSKWRRATRSLRRGQ